MGCCSSDALPDVPDVIIEDPDMNSTIVAVVKRLGGGRDFSVHKDTYPYSSSRQEMWMWFNKSNGGEIFCQESIGSWLIILCLDLLHPGVIDLENFVRGWNEKEPKKGKVLWTAVVTDRPVFDQFQRVARSDVQDRFLGFFGTSGQKGLHTDSQKTSNYDSEDDEEYLRNHSHHSKFGNGHTVCCDLIKFLMYHQSPYLCTITHHRASITTLLPSGVSTLVLSLRTATSVAALTFLRYVYLLLLHGFLSLWMWWQNLNNFFRSLTYCNILFSYKGQEIILEVFSKGTVATGWEDIETRRTDENGVRS